MNTTSLRTPADIVAAAAGMLGFAPTNSIVAYMLRRDTTHGLIVRLAIRFDITLTTDQAAAFPTTCNLRPDANHAAILLAIHDPHHNRHALSILDTLREALSGAGIPVMRRIITHNVDTNGQWYDPDTTETGPTYPYTDSVLAVQQVLNGYRISHGRADIEAEFAEIAPAPPVHVTNHNELILTIADEIADALNGHPISATLPTRAGVVITTSPALRDAMIGAAIEHPQTGADLWTHIARRLRGRPRGQALTIAAACHCATGDTIRAGIAAGIALHEAQAADSEPPRLAALILDAMRAGIHPHEIRNALMRATIPHD